MDAARDLVDRIAPPAPRERWRWIIYGCLFATIVALLAIHGSSGSYHAPGTQGPYGLHVETNGDSAVINYQWQNHGSARTLSSLRSMHDAVSILAVEGLPQRVGAGAAASITFRVRIDCTRLLATSRPVLRLEADERFGRSSRNEIDIRAVTSPGGPVCD